MSRRTTLQLLCAGLTAAATFATPLDFSTVATDSKWLVHLDVEAFRKTKIGSHFVNKIAQPKIDEMEELKKVNLSISLQNISSITAYGPAFEKHTDGVLLVRTTADVKKDLDTLCGAFSVSGTDAFKLSHLKPYPLYTFKDNLFVAPDIEGTVVVAKSKEQIETVRQVLLGKREAMSKSSIFSEYPKVADGFFFVGMAEGFNENASIPPQAQVLKETRGGRLVVGEKGDKLFANLVFKGKDDESALKIQQVFQGIIALVSLTDEEKGLTELAKAAKIAAEGRNVMLTVQFPVGMAIEHLDEEIGD
jgi:hypothetical protein